MVQVSLRSWLGSRTRALSCIRLAMATAVCLLILVGAREPEARADGQQVLLSGAPANVEQATRTSLSPCGPLTVRCASSLAMGTTYPGSPDS